MVMQAPRDRGPAQEPAVQLLSTVSEAIIGTYKKNAGLVPGSISGSLAHLSKSPEVLRTRRGLGQMLTCPVPGNRVTNAVANKMGPVLATCSCMRALGPTETEAWVAPRTLCCSWFWMEWK